VIFDAVAREGNVTRAAEKIGLTQPAVSNALTRLRSHLNDELFVRGPDRLRPIPRTIELAPLVREALSNLQYALDLPRFDPANERRNFTIAAIDYFSAVVPKAVEYIIQRGSWSAVTDRTTAHAIL